MRNECKVLVRIKKGYGWQLEEHPKIAGVVGLVGGCGWDQGGSWAWSCSSCQGREAGACLLCRGTGHFSSLWQPLDQDKRLVALWDCAREDTMSYRASKITLSPSHPVEVLKSCVLLRSKSWPEAQGLDLCSEKLQSGLGSSI